MGFGYSGGITRIDNQHKLPSEGNPNSRTDLYKNGEPIQSRWYGPTGTPIRNRDYTNHGNSMHHPIVPHDHVWESGQRGENIFPNYNWR